MKLKYFEEEKTDMGYGGLGIALGQIFSVALSDNKGNFIFREECDGFFTKELSKEDTIALFNEAIEWVETH
jgi:hypothetical protein